MALHMLAKEHDRRLGVGIGDRPTAVMVQQHLRALGLHNGNEGSVGAPSPPQAEIKAAPVRHACPHLIVHLPPCSRCRLSRRLALHLLILLLLLLCS